MVMKSTIDGVRREALVIPPSVGTATGEAPVLFAFHGHGGNMQQVADAGLQSFSPEAIVVWMPGLPTKIYVDPEGLKAGWQQEPGQYGERD
jgi:polyhydroxybutyrate depolymerase